MPTWLVNPSPQMCSPFPYAFNLFAHNSPMQENGYCEEEMKMVNETAKITQETQIWLFTQPVCVSPCCVPLKHSMLSLLVRSRLKTPMQHYSGAPGVTVLEDRDANRWPMPTDAAGHDEVFVGRIRQDHSRANTLDMWVVGDQLLKGAALNAVQCAELALEVTPTLAQFGVHRRCHNSVYFLANFCGLGEVAQATVPGV